MMANSRVGNENHHGVQVMGKLYGLTYMLDTTGAQKSHKINTGQTMAKSNT